MTSAPIGGMESREGIELNTWLKLATGWDAAKRITFSSSLSDVWLRAQIKGRLPSFHSNPPLPLMERVDLSGFAMRLKRERERQTQVK